MTFFHFFHSFFHKASEPMDTGPKTFFHKFQGGATRGWAG